MFFYNKNSKYDHVNPSLRDEFILSKWQVTKMIIDPNTGEPIAGSPRPRTRSSRRRVAAGMNYQNQSGLSSFLSYILGAIGILAMARLFSTNWQRRIIQIGMVCFIPAIFIAPSPWNFAIIAVSVIWSFGFIRLQESQRNNPERLRLLTAIMSCNGITFLALGLLNKWDLLSIIYAEGITLLLAIILVVGRRDGGW
jgi:hypothetical protein